MAEAKKSMVSLATETFYVIKGDYFLLVFLRCEDETILPEFRGKVGGLLHRSRENAAFSAIIPEFCSVSRGVLQRLTSPKNKKKGLPFSPPFCCLKVPCGIMQTPPLSKR